MAAPALDAALLSSLVPLNALRPESLSEILRKARVLSAARGQWLFRIGEDARTAYYVLSGEVHLTDADDQPRARVLAGTPAAQHRLAHQAPRKVGARVASDAQLLCVDAALLDVMLTWDQTGSFEVGELSAAPAAEHDWMARLLQMRSFQMVPPANLQAMFQRLQPHQVSAGTVVIRQGDEGDFFYVVMSGRLLVTREPPNAKPVRLAELEAGACFGEEALISDDRRNATITALTDCRLMRLDKQDFRRLLTEPLARKLGLAEAQALVASGKARWLDVRLPSEFATGSLPGAVNLPLYLLRPRLNTLDPSVTWIAVCDSGRRSAAAVFVLTQKGYSAQVLQDGLAALPQPAA